MAARFENLKRSERMASNPSPDNGFAVVSCFSAVRVDATAWSHSTIMAAIDPATGNFLMLFGVDGTLHPALIMSYYGAGGYDTMEVREKLDALFARRVRRQKIHGWKVERSETACNANVDSQRPPFLALRFDTLM